MSEPNCPSELRLLALVDEELDPSTAAAVRSHVGACFACGARHEALRRESEVLLSSLAASRSEARDARHELPWVIAAGLLISLGLVVFRRTVLDFGETVSSIPAAEALSMPRFSYWLFSLFDFTQLTQQLLYGGLLVMTMIGIAVAAPFVRRFRARTATILLATGLTAGSGVLPPSAEALEVIRGTNAAACGVPAERIIEDDVAILCEESTIAGTVRGDVYFLLGQLRVTGTVDGDLIGLAQAVEVSGAVYGSVRAAAERIEVAGDVGRSLTVAAQRLLVRDGGRVGGSLFSAGESIEIAGRVARNVTSAAARGRLESEVGGAARFYGRELHLGSAAAAANGIAFHGENEPERADGAADVDWVVPETDEEAVDPWDEGRSLLLSWGMGMGLGALLLWLWAGPLGAAAARIRRPWIPLLLGLGLFVGLPFASLLLAITVVGIPLALTLLAGWAFLIYASRLVLGYAIGHAILGAAAGPWRNLGRLALGLGIYLVATRIPVLGGAVWLLTVFFGLGALGWALLRRQTGGGPPVPTAAPSGA